MILLPHSSVLSFLSVFFFQTLVPPMHVSIHTSKCGACVDSPKFKCKVKGGDLTLKRKWGSRSEVVVVGNHSTGKTFDAKLKLTDANIKIIQLNGNVFSEVHCSNLDLNFCYKKLFGTNSEVFMIISLNSPKREESLGPFNGITSKHHLLIVYFSFPLEIF